MKVWPASGGFDPGPHWGHGPQTRPPTLNDLPPPMELRTQIGYRSVIKQFAPFVIKGPEITKNHMMLTRLKYNLSAVDYYFPWPMCAPSLKCFNTLVPTDTEVPKLKMVIMTLTTTIPRQLLGLIWRYSCPVKEFGKHCVVVWARIFQCRKK